MPSRSYEIGLADGHTNAYRHLRSIVFSTTMTESPDSSVELVPTDPLTRVRELKEEGGNGIWLCGGGHLAATLRPDIDGIVLKLHPVVAGAGVRLFDGGFDPQEYALTDHVVYENGVMTLTYAR